MLGHAAISQGAIAQSPHAAAHVPTGPGIVGRVVRVPMVAGATHGAGTLVGVVPAGVRIGATFKGKL